MKIILMLISFLSVSCAVMDRTTPTMKRTIVDASLTRGEEDPQLKKRIVILPFLDESKSRSPQLVADAKSALSLDLQKTGAFLIIPESELKLDLTKLMSANQYKLDEIAKAAKDTGVNALMEAKLIDIKVKRSADNVGIVRNLTTTFEVVAQVRVMNTRTGKEVFNTIKTVSLEQNNVRVGERVETDRFVQDNPDLIRVLVKDAFLEFTPQILAALDRVGWEGRIAAINGDRIFLNVGRVSGVQVGDLLRVTDDSGDVYDPESGLHIGRVAGRLKGTLEIISYFGTDGSIAVIHSGSGFRENDRVEVY